MSENYDSARNVTQNTLALWKDAVEPHVRGRARVLDLGSGTGRFSVPLADWSGAPVVGVEPAEGMRSRALSLSHPQVHFVGGRAEWLPLRSASFGAAFLSNVFHHVSDRPACARELARVLEPGAPVLIRGALGDRSDGITFFEYFPEAKAVCEGFPTLGEAAGVLEAAGLSFVRVVRVLQHTCIGLSELARRTALRADSTLATIPDGVFESRQKGLERAAQAEVVPAPVRDPLDLIVARKAS